MKRRKQPKNRRWILRIMLITILLSAVIGSVSDQLLRRSGLLISLATLLLIILIGVVADMVGIAIAAAKKDPFNAMASRHVPHAPYAIVLLQNASMVSNFCNDVIGDIAGIISGTAVGVIVLHLAHLNLSLGVISLITVLLSSLVAALTVGGKALGKELALTRWKSIVDFVARGYHFAGERIPPLSIKK